MPISRDPLELVNLEKLAQVCPFHLVLIAHLHLYITMASSSFRSIASSASRSISTSRAASTVCRRAYASKVVQPTPDDYDLPDIHLGPSHLNRYRDHFEETLSPDLLYMTYNPRLANRAARTVPEAKPLTPYEANLPPKGSSLRPRAKAITHATLPELESIRIHVMVKEAIGNKQQLLNGLMALRAISGEAPGGGGRTNSLGVEVIKAKKGAAAWKLREGMPIAVQVELKGDAMYDFIQSLVDFVLPRLRDYPGVPIAPFPGSHLKSHMLGPVVGFGLPPIAMGLFPQIEGNIDAYPRLHGFHIQFHSNQRGEHAQMWTRNLLSGFRIPFYRQ